jgi:hypothetical protein
VQQDQESHPNKKGTKSPNNLEPPIYRDNPLNDEACQRDLSSPNWPKVQPEQVLRALAEATPNKKHGLIFLIGACGKY